MAIISYDARVYMDSDGTGTYTELTDVVSVDTPDIEVTDTPSDALTDLIQKTLAGKIALNPWTVTVRWSKTQFNTVLGILRTGYWWRFQLADASPVTNGSKVEFQGYVRSVKPPPFEDAGNKTVDFSFQIKPTTLPAFTAAA